MRRALLKLGPEWAPTVIVLAVLLVAGTRLIALSVEQHAAQARASAQAIADRHGRAIEANLRSLAQLAQRQAARAVEGLGTKGARARLRSVAPGRDAFWIADDGKVLSAARSDRATQQGLASEWISVDAQRDAAPSTLLGPVRQGSQWIVAARAPIDLPLANGATRRAGWAVAYRDLDRVLAAVKLGEVVQEGYDFEVAELGAASQPSRVFVSSRTGALNEPATSTIHLPAGRASSLPGSRLIVGIRPRAGWYPASELAASLGLLAVVAWLFALGAHDATRNLRRLRGALTASRQRLHGTNKRLMTEIEQRQSLQESFEHARYHDAFTGLPNRRYFMDQLDRALREVRTRRGRRIAIVLADIDRFRLINDTLGHTAGDEVMVEAARRFEKATVALECVLARWSGDQFALLLFDVHSSDTAIAIARLLQDSLRPPIELRKHRVSIAASMGVTCVEAGVQRAEDVLREADVALSVAKTHDSARAIAYEASMRSDVVSVVSLEADLHIALERDEFRLLFQPIVDLRDRRIVGVEALLRWQHPVEGALGPDKFLVIAEDAGLMVPITRWILRRVCRLTGEWRRRLRPGADFYVSVNLSAASLRDPDLTGFVADLLGETQTPAEWLKLELTESGLINNVGATREILDRLHDMGIQLMLDDFGTGYSSLSHLQLFPFDYVKIDRPFVSPTAPDGVDSAVTHSMVQMVSSVGLRAIAEKVETQAAVHALRNMGCDLGQGNLFCEPVEAEEALQYMRGQYLTESQTLVEEPTPAAAGARRDESSAAEKPARRRAANGEDDASSTLVQPQVPTAASTRYDDSPTALLKPEEQAAAPADSSSTLVEPGRQLDDSPTQAEPAPPVSASRQTDDSSTLVDLAEPAAASRMRDDSPAALLDSLTPATTRGPHDDSPPKPIKRRLRSRRMG